MLSSVLVRTHLEGRSWFWGPPVSRRTLSAKQLTHGGCQVLTCHLRDTNRFGAGEMQAGTWGSKE